MESDSDDNLEDVSFLPKQPKDKSSHAMAAAINNELLPSPLSASSSKLDALLVEHRTEAERSERLEKIKRDLQNFSLDSPQDIMNPVDQIVTPKVPDIIDELYVDTEELPEDHPTQIVFRPDRFCCLYGNDSHPHLWGFVRPESEIDKILASLHPGVLNNFLMSEILPTCFDRVSSPHIIMTWLLSLISVHSCNLIVEASFTNITSILRKLKINKEAGPGGNCWWCPTPLQLFTIFVNMGADPAKLFPKPNKLYTQDVISTYLSSFDKDNEEQFAHSRRSVRLFSCQRFFSVLARCLQSRPELERDELNAYLVMIMKVALDETFKDLDLQRDFQLCIAYILQCYTESDWQIAVPELCHQIKDIPHHHHSAIYIVELVPVGDRGTFLIIRLGFVLLCKYLLPEPEIPDLKLDAPIIPLSAVVELGHPRSEKEVSKLRLALKSLIDKDVYKMRSVMYLLNRAVGDDINRSKQPKDELNYLINEVKEVIKGIRDTITSLNRSRLKDMMTYMTFAWGTFAVNPTCGPVQKSLYQWAKNAPMNEVVLEDRFSSEEDEGGLVLNA